MSGVGDPGPGAGNSKLKERTAAVPARNAIVISVDRLGSGFLGPYGNTWVETPALNRLASESLICQTAFSDTPRLDLVYRAYWNGLPAGAPLGAPPAGASLLKRLEQCGVEPCVLTDCGEVAGNPMALGFVEQLAAPPGPEAAAMSVEQTRTAHLLVEALERLSRLKPPFLLWVHAAAMNAAWDAPYEFRERLADEEDPLPPDFVIPPDQQLKATADPDLLLGLSQAYAGEVTAVDTLLGVLLDAIDESSLAADTLVVLTSPRGYALGEHGRVGTCGDQLRAEVLETPLIARCPAWRDQPHRLQNLVLPVDLFATLLDWFQVPDPPRGAGQSILAMVSEAPFSRPAVVAVADGETAIRTPIWFLRRLEDGGRELFVKPDDRWEVNEVADRCREAVEQLDEVAAALLNAARRGEPPESVDIPPELIHEHYEN